MLRLFVFVAIAALTNSSSPAADEKVPSGAAERGFEAYIVALNKGAKSAARKLTAKFDALPADYVRSYTEKYADAAKSGKLVINPVPGSAKVIDDCAVVVFEDGEKIKPDYDPAYMLQQEGEWRVLLKLTKWDSPAFEITEEQRGRFAELEAWFEGEKGRLLASVLEKGR